MVKLKPHHHSFGYNIVHIVFVTKYRHKVVSEVIESRLKQMFIRLCRTQDCELLECKADLGKKDHIHLLVDLAPKIALSKLCNILKTISSREIRKEFATELKPYYWKPVFWKRGYGYTSSGGAPQHECADRRLNDDWQSSALREILKKYIENQGYDN